MAYYEPPLIPSSASWNVIAPGGGMSLTRRSVLKSGLSLAGLVALEQLSSAEWPGTAFASDPSMIGLTWDYALRNSTGPAPSAQVAWRQQVSTQGTYNGNAFVSAALLPVGRFLPTQFSSTDTRWALWAWKHDGEPRMLMWTGPEAFGNQAGGFGDDLPKPNLTEIHIELVGSAPTGHASIYAPGQCGTDVGYTPGTAGIPLLQPPVPATMATAYSCLAIPSVPAFVNLNADGSAVSPPWQYLNDSVASGDIVWQSVAPSTAYPDGSRLVAAPHIARGRLATDGTLIDSAQDVFLLESVDGTHWTWLMATIAPESYAGGPTARQTRPPIQTDMCEPLEPTAPPHPTQPMPATVAC